MASLQICSVTAEIAPFSKTGGLGDVAAALPSALTALGHRVVTVTPRYRDYPEAWDTGLRLRFPLFGTVHEVRLFHTRTAAHGDIVFVDHPAICRGGIYGNEHGAYGDNLFRFALLSRSAIEVARRFHPGGEAPLADWGPVRFLTHDWHAGLLPVYLRAHYQTHGLLRDATSVHVIHNLAHQGQAGMSSFGGLDLSGHWASTLEMGGALNCLKGALVSADRIVTVSPTYAREICTPAFGCGLDGILRMRRDVVSGILNGIDTTDWNPRVDRHLPENYGPEVFDEPEHQDTRGPGGGKAACKAALQSEMGLPVRGDIPVVGFVGRLTGQKGIDLLEQVGGWLGGSGAAQLIILGTGEHRYEQALAELSRRWRGRVVARLAFDNGLAHRITAGSDILVMPSRFEPCGLNQLYALAYGTVPVVHATGGLADTVPSFHPGSDSGLGWAFSPASVDTFRQALGFALQTWYHHPATFRRMAQRGMAPDRGWGPSAHAYARLLGG